MEKDINNVDISEVKEISMVSDFVFFTFNEYYYKDLLRISKNWSSYVRTNFLSRKVTDEWSYKTTEKGRERDWGYLIGMVLDLFKKALEPGFANIITDIGSFNLRITLNDGSHFDQTFYGDFARNDLKELAVAFKALIPTNENVYPDFLNVIPVHFQPISLTPEVLCDIDKKDLCAFMYAEGGAMGAPGEMCVLDKHAGKYFINSFYEAPEEQVSQIEAIQTLFSGFEHRSGFDAPPIDVVTINGEKWIYVNLGMGNHLYLSRDFWREHGKKIVDPDLSRCYQNWKRLIGE